MNKIAKLSLVVLTVILLSIFVDTLGGGVYGKIYKRFTQETLPCDYGEPQPCSSNIFTGKVLRKIGDQGFVAHKPDERVVGAQYVVEVIKNVKGDATGEIIIHQYRGPTSEGILPLLKFNEEYEFAAQYNKEFNWYFVRGYSK